MNGVVLDSSALLALFLDKPGKDVVAQNLFGASISSVNLAEVTTRLSNRGLPVDEIAQIFKDARLQVEDFTTQQALATGTLVLKTSRYGLSLGDRACLALAAELKLPVLTADKIWSEIDCCVDIQVIR